MLFELLLLLYLCYIHAMTLCTNKNIILKPLLCEHDKDDQFIQLTMGLVISRVY